MSYFLIQNTKFISTYTYGERAFKIFVVYFLKPVFAGIPLDFAIFVALAPSGEVSRLFVYGTFSLTVRQHKVNSKTRNLDL
jgi:hypothetical protein